MRASPRKCDTTNLQASGPLPRPTPDRYIFITKIKSPSLLLLPENVGGFYNLTHSGIKEGAATPAASPTGTRVSKLVTRATHSFCSKF